MKGKSRPNYYEVGIIKLKLALFALYIVKPTFYSSLTLVFLKLKKNKFYQKNYLISTFYQRDNLNLNLLVLVFNLLQKCNNKTRKLIFFIFDLSKLYIFFLKKNIENEKIPLKDRKNLENYKTRLKIHTVPNKTVDNLQNYIVSYLSYKGTKAKYLPTTSKNSLKYFKTLIKI